MNVCLVAQDADFKKNVYICYYTFKKAPFPQTRKLVYWVK